MATIDEVMETVRGAREDGPEALAAMALSYGATMALGTLRIRTLRGQLAELRAAQTASDEMVATMRHERDAALAELKAERESATREDVWRLRAALDECRTARDVAMRERDEARSLAGMRDRALTAAVQEREAFGLRLSAAERERDEARAALDLSRESAREAREEIAGALALVDETRSAHDALRARPTYEARTVAPTDAEWLGHFRAGGSWLVLRPTWSPLVVVDPDTYPGLLGTQRGPWLPLGADGLPCAWPVVASE